MKKITTREKVILVGSLANLIANLKTAHAIIYSCVGEKQAKEFDKLIVKAIKLTDEAIEKIETIEEYL